MFLDLKLGILWAIGVALVFGEPITLAWVVAGVAFALLPDIDFWIELAQRGTVGGKTLGAHRTLLHNPLTFVPVALFIGALLGPAWMTLFALGVFGHFVHDSVGMGYGVRWLWPFSDHWYKFFSTKDGEIHHDFAHFLVSWSPAEMQILLRGRGNDHWLREDLTYMRHHAPSILVKMTLFLLGVTALVALLQRW